MRNFAAMSGTTPTPIPANTLNLANGKTGGANAEVMFPPDVGDSIPALNTSLWTISTITQGSTHPLNAFTVNMQAIDRVTTPNGPTGVYYAVRVATDANTPNYSNIRMSSIQLG